MSSDPSSLKGYRRIAPSSSAVVWAKIEAATPPEQRRAFSRVRTPRRALLLDSDDVAVPIVELDPDTQVAGMRTYRSASIRLLTMLSAVPRIASSVSRYLE